METKPASASESATFSAVSGRNIALIIFHIDFPHHSKLVGKGDCHCTFPIGTWRDITLRADAPYAHVCW